jgi:hypothetical protein
MPEASAPRLANAALRGTVGAMAMTGMRAFTIDFGLVDESPPQAILRQRARGLMRRVPSRRRRGSVELVHWGYGAAGGAAFALLPEAFRRRKWAGVAYGLVTWLGFEAAIAPALGLKQARRLRAVERVALAADHVLYGFVVAEPRTRSQE